MQMIAFSDFLLADILTSLAKPLSDLGIAVCHLVVPRTISSRLLDANGFDQGMVEPLLELQQFADCSPGTSIDADKIWT
jgi:hypothetical protein